MDKMKVMKPNTKKVGVLVESFLLDVRVRNILMDMYKNSNDNYEKLSLSVMMNPDLPGVDYNQLTDAKNINNIDWKKITKIIEDIRFKIQSDIDYNSTKRKTPQDIKLRDKNIYEEIKNGSTYEQISVKYSVSINRANQIYYKVDKNKSLLDIATNSKCQELNKYVEKFYKSQPSYMYCISYQMLHANNILTIDDLIKFIKTKKTIKYYKKYLKHSVLLQLMGYIIRYNDEIK